MKVRQRVKELEKLDNTDVIFHGYTIVTMLGAKTHMGIELRAVLTTLLNRLEPTSTKLVRGGQGGQGGQG